MNRCFLDGFIGIRSIHIIRIVVIRVICYAIVYMVHWNYLFIFITGWKEEGSFEILILCRQHLLRLLRELLLVELLQGVRVCSAGVGLYLKGFIELNLRIGWEVETVLALEKRLHGREETFSVLKCYLVLLTAWYREIVAVAGIGALRLIIILLGIIALLLNLLNESLLVRIWRWIATCNIIA